MANTIKLKRGLSSNLSNLVLQEGEIALTTDTNEIYSLNSEGVPESITPKVLADRTYGFASDFYWARDEQSIIPVELSLDSNSNIKVVLTAELDETSGEQTLEYELSPVISDDQTTVSLGNLSIMDDSLEDTGEPFLFVSQYQDGMFGGTMLQFNNDVVQDAHFVLYSTTSSKGLDKKLLNDNIIINVSDLSAISLEMFNLLGITQEMLIYYGYAGLFADIIEKIVVRYYTVSPMGTAAYIDHYVTNNALAWSYTIMPKVLFASNIRTMSDGTVDYHVSYRYRFEIAVVENQIKCDEEPEMVILSNQQLDWDRYNDVANRPFGEYKMNPKNSISYDGDTPGFGNISIYCGKGLNFRADGWKLKVDLSNDNFRYYEGTYSNENNEAKWSFRIEDLRYGTESEVFVGDITVAYDSATGIANFRMYREDDTEADSPFRMELVNESLNKRLSASNLDIFELSEYSPINIDVVNGTGTVNMTPIIGNSYDVIYNGITYTLKYYHFDSSDNSVSIDLMGDLYTATGNSYTGHTDIFGFAIYNDNGVIKFKTDDTSFTGTVSVQPSGKKQILKDEFLELKTVNGESIKGTGDIVIPKGDTGDSGVYIGTEQPTDEEVNVWIDPDAEGLVIPTKTSDLINDSGFITSIPSEYVTETELEDSLGKRVDEVEYRFKKYSELKKSNSDEFDWSLMKKYFSNGGVLVFDIDGIMHHTKFLGTDRYNGYYHAAPGSMGFAYYNVNTSECTFTFLTVNNLYSTPGDSGWVAFKVVVDETTNTITNPDTYWYNTFADVSNCFTGDTLIYTPHGMRNIEDIKVGDVVYSYNEVSELVEEKKVTKVESSRVSEIYDISLNDLIVHTTKEHRFYCVLDDRKDYVAAGNMSIGTELFNLTEPIKLIKAESYALDTVVYNFEVEDNCNYFITNKKILVHNAKEII